MDNTKDHLLGPLNFNELKNELINLNEVPCLLCNDFFNLERCFDLYVRHLFEVHNLVIEDVQKIFKFKSYIEYWKERFNKTNLESIVPSVEIEGTGIKYFLLSTLMKDDKKIRQQLTLEHALSLQEFERSDTTFKKQCLFCRLEQEGTRSKYLNHLSEKHNLQLGNPQNLVFIDELLEMIEDKLNTFQCIYCEKVFPDRSVLKEHMRKKIHKRINPNNEEYDRFYVVNYLDDKCDKQQRRRSHFEDLYPLELSEQNNDSEYSDWQEGNVNITCLFCKHVETNISSLYLHMHTMHKFNFPQLAAHLDFYQRVKLVNFIRRKIHTDKCPACGEGYSNKNEMQVHLREKRHCILPDTQLFDQPEYYFPTYENDAFLYFLEDLDD